jgi:SAM-dependent methyltransferase
VQTGDFLRKEPFSVKFGYDRGGPVDRYYIHQFLDRESVLIKGRVLEIGDNDYTIQYGGAKVTQSDILHIDESNKQATFIGDLSTATNIPENSFDAIILTQTLHLIYKYADALENCRRILKPGGVLLITVPGISHIAQDQWGEYWLWAFTKASMTKMLQEVFPPQNIEVNTHGNVYVASAFLYGMGLPEIKKERMDYHDPHYQVIITAKAVKPF